MQHKNKLQSSEHVTEKLAEVPFAGWNATPSQATLAISLDFADEFSRTYLNSFVAGENPDSSIWS